MLGPENRKIGTGTLLVRSAPRAGYLGHPLLGGLNIIIEAEAPTENVVGWLGGFRWNIIMVVLGIRLRLDLERLSGNVDDRSTRFRQVRRVMLDSLSHPARCWDVQPLKLT